MEYLVLDGEKLCKQGVLPASMEKLQEQNRLILFGSMEEGEKEKEEIISLAAFSLSFQYKDELSLEYVYTKPRFRGRGCCQQLLQFCFDHFKKNGIRVITCKTCGSLQKTQNSYHFLVAKKFVPLTFDGHILEYFLDEVLESETLRKAWNPDRPEVAAIWEQSDRGLRSFCIRCEERGVSINRIDYDPAFSRFYIENGEIAGAVMVERVAEDMLFLSQIYTEPGIGDKFALLYLLAESLKEAGKAMPENTRLRIQLFDQVYSQVIKKVLGEPYKDYIIQEFACLLKDKNTLKDKNQPQ